MNLFAIPAEDQSVAMLIRIFGHVGGVLPATKEASLILGTMFKTFNTVMLTLGALLIVYTTVVGLLATAHEGEFMGKKWSGLWVPLRSLIGIASLFPTASGYSVLQVIIMWVILQGVGAADKLWDTVISYTQIAGSPLSTPNFPSVGIDGKIQTLFQSLACQSASKIQSKVGDKNYYYCGDKSGGYCGASEEELWDVKTRSTLTSDQKNYLFKIGPEGSCGTMSFCNPDPYCATGDRGSTDERIKCAACKAQREILIQMVPTLGKVAQKFAQVDNDYFGVWFSLKDKKTPDWIQQFCKANGIKDEKDCCVWRWTTNQFGIQVPEKCEGIELFRANPWSPDEKDTTSPSQQAVKNFYYPYQMSPYLKGLNYVEAATNYFVSGLGGALATFIATLKPVEPQDDWRATARKSGWLVAGAFYNKMADESNKSLDNAKPDFNVVTGVVPESTMAGYRNIVKGSDYLRDVYTETTNATPSPAMNRLSTDLNWAARGIFNNWRHSMHSSATASDNPLAELHMFGRQLLITAEVLYPIIITAAAMAGAADISFIALGTGPIEPFAWLKYIVLIGFMPAAFFILGLCLTFGGLLAVYVPLIPYIIFTLTALGWFIATIEAMVASPLIALGILSPGGQHEILGRAEPALMLLLGVLLRPTLMIFGLMAAMLLSYAGLMFIDNTFGMVMGDVDQDPSITMLIVFLAAYTFLVISVLNKCFSLIHLVPERVMTWIGGQAVSYGEGEGLGEVKRGAEGAGATVAGGAKGAAAAGQGHMQGMGKRAEAKRADLERKAEIERQRGRGGGTPN